GHGYESREDLAAFGAGHVDRGAALIAVEVVEVAAAVGRALADVWAEERAAEVEACAALDLDHIGAEVGEDARRLRSGHRPAEVEDAQIGERARHDGCSFGIRPVMCGKDIDASPGEASSKPRL